jgi:hypothetical protein
MRHVVTYWVARLLNYALIALLSFTIVFLFLRLMPGDPVGNFLHAMRERGMRVEGHAATVDAYAGQFGLEGTLLEQYLATLQRTFLHGDLGVSLMGYPRPVEDLRDDLSLGLPGRLAHPKGRPEREVPMGKAPRGHGRVRVRGARAARHG